MFVLFYIFSSTGYKFNYQKGFFIQNTKLGP